jgi:hypothetical protein
MGVLVVEALLLRGLQFLALLKYLVLVEMVLHRLFLGCQ